jgi:hypothetical protein
MGLAVLPTQKPLPPVSTVCMQMQVLLLLQGIRVPGAHVDAQRQGEAGSVAASQTPPFLLHLFFALIRRQPVGGTGASAHHQRLPPLPS